MLSDVLIRLRGLVRHDAVENELDDELRFHFEQQVKKYVQGGVPLAEARRRARLEFGGSEQIKEECREARGTHFVDTLARDVRYGLRMLRKSPGFTAVAILTLALGIGANTAIFSVFDAVMLRSLPVRDPQKLVVFGWKAHTHPKFEHYGSFGDCNRDSGTFGCSFSTPFFEQMRASAAQFSNLTAFAGAVQLNSSGTGPAGIAHGELISGDFFATFGVTTTLGRPIGPDDDLLSSPLVAVLSYTYWQSAFGGDRSVIGRTVRLNSVPIEHPLAHERGGNVRSEVGVDRYRRAAQTGRFRRTGAGGCELDFRERNVSRSETAFKGHGRPVNCFDTCDGRPFRPARFIRQTTLRFDAGGRFRSTDRLRKRCWIGTRAFGGAAERNGRTAGIGRLAPAACPAIADRKPDGLRHGRSAGAVTGRMGRLRVHRADVEQLVFAFPILGIARLAHSRI